MTYSYCVDCVYYSKIIANDPDENSCVNQTLINIGNPDVYPVYSKEISLKLIGNCKLLQKRRLRYWSKNGLGRRSH